MKKQINIIDKKTLYSGFYELNKFKLKHKKYDGSWSNEIIREVFKGAHVSTVLPYDPIKKKIILIEQFRAGLIDNKKQNIMRELVAGIINKEETPENAAIRECREETGCEVKKIKKIFSYYPAPGGSQSYFHFFLAEIDSFEEQRIVGERKEDEDILANCYSIKEVKKMYDEYKIINGSTIIALQWFFLNYKDI